MAAAMSPPPDDESILSSILTIVPAIDVLSLLLFEEFFVFPAFASEDALAIALVTLFPSGGVESATLFRAVQTLCDTVGGNLGEGDGTNSPSASRELILVYAATIGVGGQSTQAS